MENPCTFCPHEADLNKPPAIDPANAPRTHFICGHSVHTQCLFVKYYENGGDVINMSRCAECDSSLISQEFNAWINNRFRARDDRYNNIEDLWTKNEVFREDVKQLSVVGRQFSSSFRAHDKDIRVLKREYKDIIQGSVTFIESQSEVFNKRLIALPSRKTAIRAKTKYNKLMKSIMETYDISRYEMRFFEKTKKVPRIPRMYRYNIRSHMGRYVFRVRIG